MRFLRTYFISFIMAVILLSFIFLFLLDEMKHQSYEMLHKDLQRVNSLLEKKLAMVSIDTIKMAEEISRSVDMLLKQKGKSVRELNNSHETVEEILEEHIVKAMDIMSRNRCSGVFVILNATVNTELANSDGSKSCFYIRDIEPFKTVNAKDYLFLLRGSPSIARKFGMHLDTQWDLEYNTNLVGGCFNTDLFNKPFKAAMSNRHESISSLGYWGTFSKVSENCEKAMTFSAPLIDGEGNVFGVCGLELSQKFFEAAFPITSSTNHERIFFMLSVAHGDTVNVKSAGFLGNSMSFLASNPQYITATRILNKNDGIKLFKADIGKKTAYIGTDSEMALYTKQSVFSDERWILTALVPEEDMGISKKHSVSLLFFAILILGVIFLYPTSRNFKSSSKETLLNSPDNTALLPDNAEADIPDSAKADILPENSEIELVYTENPGISPEQLEEFEARLKSFTKTEREIFDLYIAGYSIKQICQERCITTNTIKTHNRHIYSKMNVSSRTELLTYCAPFSHGKRFN